MSASRERVRIDDLGRPRLPGVVRAANALGAPVAGLVSLAPDALLETAARRTGLDDFGPEDFREPMAVWLDALEREADLHPFGRYGARQLALGLLTQRLRAVDLLARQPEIRAQPVRAPIVIMGLPRTGTTHLHSLIAQDDSLRSLPYWESSEPVPKPDEPRPERAEDDPRYRRSEASFAFLHRVMPLFPLMHEMSAGTLHEEIQLLATAFQTMLFESSHKVPSYRDWYLASDQTAAYRWLRALLQILQCFDGRPRRWVLKSPQHLEQIGPLLAVFPDACIVQTHRDPVRVTASMTTMGVYGLRMGTTKIDLRSLGRYWADRIERMLRTSLEDRSKIPEAQLFDLRFDDFMADNLKAVEQVYAFAGLPFEPGVERRVRAYADAHAQGRHGSVDYRLEDFAIDPDERYAALRFYQERFGLPEEW